MDFSYSNDSLWQTTLTQFDLENYDSPCLGNGLLGVRAAPLIVTPRTENKYPFLSKMAYDNGRQIVLPSFNCVELDVSGVLYCFKNGSHNIKQTLDIRNGVISQTDEWEYKQGSFCKVDSSMLVSREYDEVAALTFSVSGAPENSKISFGISFDTGFLDGTMSWFIDVREMHAINALKRSFSYQPGLITGEYVSKTDHEEYTQLLNYKVKGNDTLTDADEPGMLTACFSDSLSLKIFSRFGTKDDQCADKLETIAEAGYENLVASNEKCWKHIWDRALAFSDCSEERSKSLLLYQFHLLCSCGGRAAPTGALGVSSPGWFGNQLWDTDLWMFGAVLPLWPELALPMVEYRFKHLDAARQHAADQGYGGAWFPWMSDNNGLCREAAEYKNEIHNNIWVAWSAYMYYLKTKDWKYMKEIAYPIIKNIADFFVSRSSADESGIHIHNVVGPDEHIAEVRHTTVSDHFCTNFGARTVLKYAIELAQELNETVPKEWHDFYEKIVILEPDCNGIIPEYVGYDGGTIKQADAILAFFPLGYEAPAEQIISNVEYYHDRLFSVGPLMSCQIEAAIYMKCGLKDKGLNSVFEQFEKNVRGKYRIPYECVDNNNSIMLTGIGGLLQSLIYGYYGYNINDPVELTRIKDLQ